MNDLASEFFFESVRRIIPGLALIIICFRQQAAMCFHNHHNFFEHGIFFAVCLIALAWPLGVIIESITFHPVVWVINLFKKQSVSPSAEQSYKAVETDYEREMRRQDYLFEMTRVMCRCIAAVLVFRLLMFWPSFMTLINSDRDRDIILLVCIFETWLAHYVGRKSKTKAKDSADDE